MRAIVVDRYGPPEVAQLRELPTPAPRAGEVLVRVLATPVTSGDARMRSGVFPPGFAVPARAAIGFRGPRVRVLGVAFAGEVAALGPGVDTLTVGDRVAGMTGTGCGAHAEFVRVKAAKAVPLPDGLAPDDAAAVLFGGSTALDYLQNKAKLAPGATVLVNGASGAVGSAAVQLARHLGAHVAGVASAANAAFVRGLGAERVVDYRATSLDALADAGERFDVVLDAVGNLRASLGRRLLTDGGTLLLAVATLGETITARGNVKAGPASEARAHLAQVLQLAADGVLAPLIEQRYPLAEVASAYARVDSGRKVGNVVLSVG